MACWWPCCGPTPCAGTYRRYNRTPPGPWTEQWNATPGAGFGFALGGTNADFLAGSGGIAAYSTDGTSIYGIAPNVSRAVVDAADTIYYADTELRARDISNTQVWSKTAADFATAFGGVCTNRVPFCVTGGLVYIFPSVGGSPTIGTIGAASGTITSLFNDLGKSTGAFLLISGGNIITRASVANTPHDVVARNSAGVSQWNATFSVAGMDRGGGVGCVDASGNIYVAAHESATNTMLLEKFNSAGVSQWHWTASSLLPLEIVADSDGIYLVVTGSNVISRYLQSTGAFDWSLNCPGWSSLHIGVDFNDRLLVSNN